MATQSVRKEVLRIGNDLVITFPYDPAIIAAVKTLPRRKWDAEKKAWTAPATQEAIQKLEKLGFSMPPDPAPIREKIHKIKTIDGIKRPLLPYQMDAVNFFEETNGRALLGDQQGLGKTSQPLAWLHYRSDIRPVVVLCPGSAKWGFESEAKYVAPDDKVYVISGEYKRGNVLPQADIYVLNYDILSYTSVCPDCEGDKKVEKGGILTKCTRCKGKGKIVHLRPDLPKPKAVIIDECHYLQDPTSDRTMAAKQLCQHAKHIIPMSGTPIRKRPKQFYTALNLVRPDLFPSFFRFGVRYCASTKTPFGWNHDGASNMGELHNLLVTHKVMLRRTKEEVLPQLPRITRSQVIIDLSKKDRAEYDHADSGFLDWLAAKDITKLAAAERAEALVKINHLKKLAVACKYKAVLEWIDNFLIGGEKFILFAHHKHIVEKLKTHYKDNSVFIDGTVGNSGTHKRDAETEFQACAVCGVKKDKHTITEEACGCYVPNKKTVFIGTLAAKEALTLTAASDVGFLELWDSCKDHEQAEERCYGRVSDPHGANAWYFIAKGTIEEKIMKVQDIERAIIDSIVDGKEVEIGESALTELLKEIKR